MQIVLSSVALHCITLHNWTTRYHTTALYNDIALQYCMHWYCTTSHGPILHHHCEILHCTESSSCNRPLICGCNTLLSIADGFNKIQNKSFKTDLVGLGKLMTEVHCDPKYSKVAEIFQIFDIAGPCPLLFSFWVVCLFLNHCCSVSLWQPLVYRCTIYFYRHKS